MSDIIGANKTRYCPLCRAEIGHCGHGRLNQLECIIKAHDLLNKQRTITGMQEKMKQAMFNNPGGE